MTNDELDALEKRARERIGFLRQKGYEISGDEVQDLLDSHASLRRQLANQRSRYDEIIAQADKRAASLQSSVATLNAQLAAERERAEKAEGTEDTLQNMVMRAEAETYAAKADARELWEALRQEQERAFRAEARRRACRG